MLSLGRPAADLRVGVSIRPNVRTLPRHWSSSISSSRFTRYSRYFIALRLFFIMMSYHSQVTFGVPFLAMIAVIVSSLLISDVQPLNSPSCWSNFDVLLLISTIEEEHHVIMKLPVISIFQLQQSPSKWSNSFLALF